VAGGAGSPAAAADVRKRRLQSVIHKGNGPVIEPVSIVGEGRRLFDLVQANDLEGVVAKRRGDAYGPRAKRGKVLNPTYSQRHDGRAELLNR
jgi:ATP-dependent DNA ligase